MSNLWNPTKDDKTFFNRGERKVRMYNYRREGRLTETKCICGKNIYLLDGKKKITVNGANHTCVASCRPVLKG